MKKKIDKEKLFMAVLVGVLITIFVILFTYGLDSVLAMEGNMPPNILTQGNTPAPSDKNDAVNFLNNVISKTLADKPKLEKNKRFYLDRETIVTDANEQVKSIMNYVSDGFVSQLNSNFDSVFCDFGEELVNKLNNPKISADDVIDFKCEYIYYACPSCGTEKDEELPDCEDCGGIYPYNMKYRDEYTVTLTIVINDSILEDNFNKKTAEEAIALCGDTLGSFAEINALDITYDELKIIYSVNRLTDELTYLEYSKKMKVSADTLLLGKFSSVGKVNTFFEITETDEYTFTWANLELSEKEIVVEPKDKGNLLANLTCTDPLNATVNWSSSDESILTVDSDGYYTATNKTGEAKIIASFEFGGKTYKDECTVKVMYSVESSKISEKNIELSVGETKQLSVTVSPKKATIQTVKWYSENEDIATVDENGVIAAVSQGTVIVYSLTNDGYFKSSCEVTVK